MSELRAQVSGASVAPTGAPTESVDEPVMEPTPRANEVDPTGETAPRAREGLSLGAAVKMALRNNRSLEKAGLRREVERFDLRVAEDQFVPDVDIYSSSTLNPIRSGGSRSELETNVFVVSGSQRLPTGGRVALVVDSTRTDISTSTGGADYSSSIYMQFNQPLLRGGGLAANLAALRIARLSEKGSVLSYRRAVMDTVTEVVFAYRRLVRAKLQLEVAETAVLRAREQMRINRALVDSGNLPPVEIIQTEADIASQEYNLLTARSALDSARYALVRLLAVDRDAALDPTDSVVLPAFTLDLPDALRLAYANRPDYLQLQYYHAMAVESLKVARNNQLWDVSLNSRYRVSGDGSHFTGSVDRTLSREEEDWAVGISLNIPLGDLTRRRAVLAARSREMQASVDLTEARHSIDIELRDAFRSLSLSRERVRIAAVARELSSSKLEIEKAKLQTGRTTNFAIVTFQNDLVRARLNEIGAQIDYLNALTDLDQTLGTTLTTWGIQIVDLDNDAPPETSVEGTAASPATTP